MLSSYFKTRPPSCALGTSFYIVSEDRDLMTYVSDNYTSYNAPSPPTALSRKTCSYLLYTGNPLQEYMTEQPQLDIWRVI